MSNQLRCGRAASPEGVKNEHSKGQMVPRINIALAMG